MGRPLTIVVAVMLSAGQAAQSGRTTVPPEPTMFYVFAPGGLALRGTPHTDGRKVATLAYGEAVEVVEPAAASVPAIDGLAGGMAHVKAGEQTGYAFDGYLVPLPPAKAGEQADAYCERLRRVARDVLYEKVERDWGGYLQETKAIYLKSATWPQAFLVARQLFDIPRALTFPGEVGTGKQQVDTPHRDTDDDPAWIDALEVEYGADGKLTGITYRFRREGGGTTVMIERATEDGYMFKISSTAIGD